MSRRVVLAVLVVVAASCSSSDADVATTSTIAGISSTTTSSTVGVTSTTEMVAAGDDCVEGSWDLVSQPFFDQIADSVSEAEAPTEFTYVSGVYRITASPDGTFLDERIDWTFAVRTDFGDMQMTINHMQTGTYSFADGMMSTMIPGGQGTPDVTITIDGVPFTLPGGANPFEAPDASFDSAAVACGEGTLTVEFDGFTSMWERSA